MAKEYEDNIKLLSQTDAALQPFVTNQQVRLSCLLVEDISQGIRDVLFKNFFLRGNSYTLSIFSSSITHFLVCFFTLSVSVDRLMTAVVCAHILVCVCVCVCERVCVCVCAHCQFLFNALVELELVLFCCVYFVLELPQYRNH